MNWLSGTSVSTLPYDVAILPSDDLASKAIRASKNLEPFGTMFTLQIGKYYPHTSVYMLQLKVGDIPKVKELLASIAAKISVLNLAAARYYQTECYFDVEYQKTEKLNGLQAAVVEALNPIRDGMRERDKARMQATEGLALENLKRYGFMSIGELYRPHLTLTRFNKEQLSPDRNLPDIDDFSGQFQRLGLFEMGDNGTCVHKIAEFDLSGGVR